MNEGIHSLKNFRIIITHSLKHNLFGEAFECVIVGLTNRGNDGNGNGTPFV